MTDGRPIVRRVLVLSPRFVPTDSVDLHRIRSNVGHYSAFGWQPTVLAVRPDLCGRPVLPELAQTVPADLDVRHCGAVPLRLARRFGVTALGIRAFGHLLFAGLRLLRRERFDLVYVTTTEFVAMPLAAIWRRLTGVPFVLDFQDPWASDYEGAGTGDFVAWKYRLMRRIHRFLERCTVTSASGLIAVSGRYIEDLHRRHPRLKGRPAEVVPFGLGASDIAVALGQRDASPRVAQADGRCRCAYVGRLGSAMAASVDCLLDLVAAGRTSDPTVFERIELVFVGTAYSGDTPEVGPAASRRGIASLVSEQASRVPYFEALRIQHRSDFLLMFGSDSGGYVPSKLATVMAMERPVIAFARPDSEISRVLSPLPTAIVFDPGATDPVDGARRLRDFLLGGDRDFSRQQEVAAGYGARSMAEREARVFDSAIA